MSTRAGKMLKNKGRDAVLILDGFRYIKQHSSDKNCQFWNSELRCDATIVTYKQKIIEKTGNHDHEPNNEISKNDET